MGVAENKKLIQDIFGAWAGGDSEAFFNALDDNVRWTVIGTTPVSGTYTSRQQFLERAVRPLFDKLEGKIQPTLLKVIAEGDNVVVQWQGRATDKTGKPYNNSYCWVMRLESGRVREGMAYLDTELVSELWRS